MKSLGTMRLETDRLALRRFEPDDAEAMFANWASDPKANRFLSWKNHADVSETREVIAGWIARYADPDEYNWAVELKDTGKIIGSICAESISKANETVSVGYCFGSAFWGNGYATEALRRVIEFFLLDVDMRLVEARFRSSNPASGRVMEKAGMRRDGVLRSRKKDKLTGEYSDLVVFSIIKEEL